MRSLPLLLTAAALLPGEEAWTVPDRPTPLVVEAQGYVTAPRDRERQVSSPGKDQVLRDLLPEGARVVRGQRIAVLDTTRIAREIPVREHDLAIAEAEARKSLLEAEGRLAGLEARQRSLQAELAGARAALVALAQEQAAAVTQAEARIAQARQAELAAQRAVAAAELRVAAGDLPADDAAAARHRLRLAGYDRQEAELACEARRSIPPRRQRDLVRRIDELRSTLGLRTGPEGADVVDPGASLNAQLAWARESVARAQRQALAEIDRRRASLAEARRAAADAVPLAYLTATPLAGGEPRRIDVLPAGGGDAAPGWQADHGEVWDPRRGYGWVTPPGDAGIPPSHLVPSEDERAGPGHTVRVLDAPAVFLWQLPPGRWRVQVGLGDRFPWDGGVVAIDGVGIVHVRNRIEAEERVKPAAEVTVDGGPVTIRFGDEPGRSLRAPGDGVLLLAPGVERGGRSGWPGRPLAWVVDPASLRIAVRLPTALQPLFSTGEPADGPLAALAVREADLLLPGGGEPLRATVTALGQRPVSLRATAAGWDPQEASTPADGVAREVELRPADGQRLLPRQAVTLRARIPLPEGTWAVPPHLVRRDGAAGDGWVRTRFGERRVDALALGPAVVVTGGLRGGDRLLLPDAPTAPVQPRTEPGAAADQDVLLGRLVAGAAVPVVTPPTWGRVQDLRPDGSDVQAGDELMTLQNPWLEGRTKERAEALRRVVEEAERDERERSERRESADRARDEERDAERSTRRTYEEALDPPAEGGRATLPARIARVAAERERAEAVATGRAPFGGPAAAEAQVAAQRARLAEDRLRLDAAQIRIPAWRTVSEAGTAWEDALGRLGLRPGRDALDAAVTRRAWLGAQSRKSSGQWELEVEADFQRHRRITAPVAGRLQWRDGWDESTNSMAKMGRGLSVWGGMPLGEILDVSALDLLVEVPEDRYGRLAVGLTLEVVLPERGDLRLTATVTAIGGVLLPADRGHGGADLAAAVRVATVRARLEPTPGLRPPLAPGLRAQVRLPPGKTP